MKLLITGGAGFIGSNIAKSIIDNDWCEKVFIVDNLLTGSLQNIKSLEGNRKFEFIEGDIRNQKTCESVVSKCTHVCHQAALGSVPRSVKDPITTNEHNVNGTLNILNACRNHNIIRTVFASSSSVYGDDLTLPKQESKTGNVLSPYALTKKTKEEYAKLFSELYGLSIVGLRYFNVFGPHQSPKGAYAAVIPIFINLVRKGIAPTIDGDGEQSRDFTYIDNVVNANILALTKDEIENNFQIFNIALGEKTSINQLYNKIAHQFEAKLSPNYGPTRTGDIRDSLANISKIQKHLNYKPLVDIDEGLKKTVEWFNKNFH